MTGLARGRLALASALVGVLLVVTAGTSGASTVRPTSDPVLPTVVAGIGEVSAPAPGATAHLHVPITLSAPSSQDVRVHWTTTYVASAPSVPEPQAPTSDYTASAGVAVVPAGSTTKVVTVPVTGDAAAQFEYLVVSFTDPTNAAMGGYWGLGFGLIDPAGARTAPTISFDAAAIFPYGGEPVAVRLSHPSARPITVTFSVTDGTDAVLDWGEWIGDAADFTPSAGTVTFAPGQVTAFIDLTVLSPNVTGCSGYFPPSNCYPSAAVTLSDPTNATLGSIHTTGLPYVLGT